MPRGPVDTTPETEMKTARWERTMLALCVQQQFPNVPLPPKHGAKNALAASPILFEGRLPWEGVRTAHEAAGAQRSSSLRAEADIPPTSWRRGPDRYPRHPSRSLPPTTALIAHRPRRTWSHQQQCLRPMPWPRELWLRLRGADEIGILAFRSCGIPLQEYCLYPVDVPPPIFTLCATARVFSRVSMTTA